MWLILVIIIGSFWNYPNENPRIVKKQLNEAKIGVVNRSNTIGIKVMDCVRN